MEIYAPMNTDGFDIQSANQLSLMHEGIKIALDPTPSQIKGLRQHAGAARFAYNTCLAHVIEERKKGNKVSTSFYGLRKWWNQNKEEKALWWRECSKEAYAGGCESLALAYKNYFEGKKNGRNVGCPKFKSRNRSRPSFSYTTGSFGPVEGDPYRLKLPRIGSVHTFENVEHRIHGGRVLRMTVSEDGGRWYACVLVEREEFFKPARTTDRQAGVDLGIKAHATLSDGTVFENPKYLERSERKLKKAQKALSRKQKGSNRWEKQRRKVNRLHARIRHQREDHAHKMTTQLVKDYDTIVIEDLSVKGMVQDHKLAKSVQDAGFYQIRRMLEYKCAQRGRTLKVIDRYEPSSKRCSRCGHVKTKLGLEERTYRCENCGFEADRDLNAAINILAAGSAPEAKNGRGENGRPALAGSFQGSVNQRRLTQSELELSLATGICKL